MFRAVPAYQKMESVVADGFGFAENNEAAYSLVIFKQVLEQVDLRLQVGHLVTGLDDRLRGGSLRRYLYDSREFQEIAGYFMHQFAHRGREQQVLPFAWDHFQDTVQLTDESHIHHLVRFVHHQHVEGFGDHVAGEVQVEEPPGGGYHDIGTLLQSGNLGLRTEASVQCDGSQVGILSKELDVFFNLHG